MTGFLYPFIKAEKRHMRRNLRFSYVFTLFDAMILILLVNNFKKQFACPTALWFCYRKNFARGRHSNFRRLLYR